MKINVIDGFTTVVNRVMDKGDVWCLDFECHDMYEVKHMSVVSMKECVEVPHCVFVEVIDEN